MVAQDEINIPQNSIHQKPNSAMSVMLCTGYAFSFNSYVYYLTRGFITSTGTFNLPTRAFSLLTRGFELVNCRYEFVTRNS